MQYSGDTAVVQEWHVYFFGGYELAEVAAIKDILGLMKAPIVFDIGANLGGHAFPMASLAEEVHAFEPYGPLAARIADQAAENKINNIHLHQYGLGQRSDMLTYYFDKESNNSGTGSFKADHTGADGVAQLEIRKGDDCELPAPGFVKIDVEGFEAPALQGLARTLSAATPVIMMEVTESSWETFKEYGGLSGVLDYDYVIYKICQPKPIIGLFQNRTYRLERIEEIIPRSTSFNVLIVPADRASLVERLP